MTFNFTCAICGGEFVSHRDQAEAWAEAESRYGSVLYTDEVVQVCDDCHGPYLEWFSNLTPAEKAQIEAGA